MQWKMRRLVIQYSPGHKCYNLSKALRAFMLHFEFVFFMLTKLLDREPRHKLFSSVVRISKILENLTTFLYRSQIKT